MDVSQVPEKKANTLKEEHQQSGGGWHGLSSAQKRMVMMQQAAPESTAYVETIAVRTTNQIEPRDVFKTLTSLHPILTSKIDMDGNRKEFVVTLGSNVAFDVKPEVLDADIDVEDYIKQSTPVINIFHEPLVQYRYCIQGENHILVLHIHHLIVDIVTIINIWTDVHGLIEGASNVQGAPVSPTSYSSFVAWESTERQSARHGADQVFWKETFSSMPTRASLAVLPLSECEWSDASVYKARQAKIILPRESTESISKYCKSIGVTPFKYYLACTMLVYQRYIGTEDVTLAVPISTRPQAHQNTDGLFVNTVFFRKVLRTDMTFTDYVKDVAKSWMETYSHSQYPLEEVVKIVKEAHGMSMSSFCCMMFGSYTMQTSNVMRIPAKHAKMPVEFDVTFKRGEETIEIVVGWAEEFIDAGVAQRLAEGVVHTFCKAYQQADDVTQSIQVLSSAELDLLESFGRHPGKSQTIPEQPVHVAFEDHAVKNPELIAVSCRDVSLTYKQLNIMASSIAQGLLENTDQVTLQKRPVVIVMENDEYTVASVLGIWKAGGHFLPVAVSFQNLLKGIFERCEPATVLYNTRLKDLSIPTTKQCPVLNVKDLTTYPADDMVQSRLVGKTPVDNLAYVMRTSGSTGIPKQCSISHRSLGIVAAAYTKMYNLPDMTVNCLQWAPISFGVFIAILVRALVSSPGRLTICPDEFRLDVFHILDLIHEQNVNLVEFTPQLARHLVENAKLDQLESIQLLIIGSDVLQVHFYNRIKDLLNSNQRVLNGYGMTEATMDSSFFEGPVVSRTRSGMVPIGKPFPGVRYHVLNSSTLQPCPVGTVGELYISGDVLASGDAELVHLEHLQCVALKTGDAAYWLPTGDIDLMGRLNRMVKLRGLRIGTTEIENKILQLVPGVKAACVVPMTNSEESGSTDQSLCAFLVLDESSQTGGIEIDRRSVCQKLQGDLPNYMLPNIVSIIDEVPLTPNGKVNYKILPSINDIVKMETKKETTDNTVETKTASTLRMLLAEAMGFPDSSRIPSDTTFMELGAHSLVLVRFSVLLRQKTNFDVKVTDLFDYPSLRSLADYIEQQTR
ncbi:bacitracin synthase 2-like isoform X1 [Patiria miniata]|uniref:Carrier domain-containing protein n=1 Tax=Patiria miniata TaxID=46514 RepID=A0A913ZQ60_PATMI|nr:bacitracin synthase 2-like isoform X1 [Patiria miniata]